MTIVVVYAGEGHRLMAFSDSRVSSDTPLLDSVAKLLPLRAQVFNNKLEVVSANTFGFAFAGSTLVAQAVYSFAVASLQSMRTDDVGISPSLFDICEYIKKLLFRIGHEMGERVSNPNRITTSLFLFGFCPIQQCRKLYKIETQINSKFSVSLDECDVMVSGRSHFIGDKFAISRFWDEYNRLEKPTLDSALLNVIQAIDVPSVGGDLQAFSADVTSVSPIPTLQKTERGTGTLKLLNQNVDDLTVGKFHFKHIAIGVG